MSRPIAQLKKDKRTKAKKQREFLEAFGECASVSRAAKKSKVPRRTIYEWLKADTAFKTAYEDVCTEALGVLEDEAVRRAYEGLVKPVFQGGKKVGAIREYSDTLLIVLLKARAPEKYSERRQISGPGGRPLIPDPLSPASNVLTIEIISPNEDPPVGPASEEPAV